ncbi:multiple antibiotic resistance protein MarB [Franconibacter pulveris 1160]|jgi:multiple antibiotic resistance protein MarB|uniref:Multiple antibiotic resistance protein MarB n=2 Tax=Franconibacter TaxID=1649295 RepID=A0A0J8VPV9_9ENTR|nr:MULTISPECIES: multiple antibiotic resistance protein MarB [Franconibacter]KMV34997.1 hypothetical protein ACH50_09585 [Franconibacter pulveris]MCK1968083.1 multiple antibiotic resistance protein MarB [Franconibacter sp. IITDAS19]GGD16794.1 multiple antibiotic resistance regulatory periplasmic protein MarB [Franconibacter daqui]HBI11349.1 multiple antibiotic resistance protein MarB [Franconibacter pulveris]
MKRIASATLFLLALASAGAMADQNTALSHKTDRDAMVLPSATNQSPFDFNHRGAGSDKSDELGVPYYNASR